MKSLIDLAAQLAALERSHPTNNATATFKLGGQELTLVRVPAGLTYALSTETHSIVLVLYGVGSLMCPGWRATVQPGQCTDVAPGQRVEVAADGETAVAFITTRALTPALEEKTPPAENRLAPPEAL